MHIRYIHWAENSSQPMKDSLFLGYIILNLCYLSEKGREVKEEIVEETSERNRAG